LFSFLNNFIKIAEAENERTQHMRQIQELQIALIHSEERAKQAEERAEQAEERAEQAGERAEQRALRILESRQSAQLSLARINLNRAIKDERQLQRAAVRRLRLRTDAFFGRLRRSERRANREAAARHRRLLVLHLEDGEE
jgi:hypothetical protein